MSKEESLPKASPCDACQKRKDCCLLNSRHDIKRISCRDYRRFVEPYKKLPEDEWCKRLIKNIRKEIPHTPASHVCDPLPADLTTFIPN